MYGYAFKNVRDGAAYVCMYLLVEFKCAARTEHYAESSRYSLFSYAVFFGLLYGCQAANGVVDVLVYGAFSTPGASIYCRSAVVGNSYHRVVVVDKCASLYMFYP